MSFENHLIFVPPKPKFVPKASQLLDFEAFLFKHHVISDFSFFSHKDNFEGVSEEIKAYNQNNYINYEYALKWKTYKDFLEIWFNYSNFDEDIVDYNEDEDYSGFETLNILVNAEEPVAFTLGTGSSQFINTWWPDTPKDPLEDYLVFYGHMCVFIRFVRIGFFTKPISDFYNILLKIELIHLIKQGFKQAFGMTPELKVSNTINAQHDWRDAGFNYQPEW